jgi:hypothetical protein
MWVERKEGGVDTKTERGLNERERGERSGFFVADAQRQRLQGASGRRLQRGIHAARVAAVRRRYPDFYSQLFPSHTQKFHCEPQKVHEKFNESETQKFHEKIHEIP